MSKITGFFMIFVMAALIDVPVSAQVSDMEELDLKGADEARLAEIKATIKARLEELEAYKATLKGAEDEARQVERRAMMVEEIKASLNALRAAATEARLAAQRSELKVYEIKHQKALDIIELLPPSLNGAAYVQVSEKFNTISLEAVPQVHDMVASIIKKYDVPKEMITFEFFLVKASNSGESAMRSAESLKDKLPGKVLTALNEVAGLTRYKSFELIASPIILTREGVNAEIRGEADETGSYGIQIRGIGISNEAIKRHIRIDRFSAEFGFIKRGMTTISTALEFTEGELIVIGVSSLTNADPNSGTEIMLAVTAKITD